MITFKQYITETFKYTKRDNLTYTFDADDIEFEVSLAPMSNNAYDVSFGIPSRGMQRYETTNYYRNSHKIINTVYRILTEVAQHAKLGDIYNLAGNNKKADIYGRLAKKFIRNHPKWTLIINDHGYGKTFRLEKIR